MLKNLIKIRLRAALCSMATRKKKGNATSAPTANIVVYVLLYTFISVLFLGIFAMMAFSLGFYLLPDLPDVYYGIFTLLTFTVLFIFGAAQTKSEIFDCKDNELLMSMPIPMGTIVASRVLSVLILNYIEAVIVFMPSLAAYIFFGGSPLGIVGGILVFLLLPLLITAVSSGAGYVIALISKKIKNKTFVTTLLYALLLGAYLFVYFYFIDNMDAFFEDLENGTGGAMSALGPVGIIGSVAMLSPLPVTVFIVLCFGLAALAYYLISKNYLSIVSAKGAGRRVKYVAKKAEGRSVLSALTIKELRVFFSSATYIINGAIGLLFTVALAVIALINRAELIEISTVLSEELGFDAERIIAPVVICGVMFFLSTVMISASALSLEGKNLWLLKSLPVTSRQVLFSKTLPHIILSLPVAFVSSVLLFIATGASAVYLPFFILIPASYSILSAFLGTVFNVAFPKFEFQNEAQVVKQSMATFLAMMSTMIYALVLFGAIITLSLIASGIVACIFVLFLNVGLSVLFGLLIAGPLAKRYESFE